MPASMAIAYPYDGVLYLAPTRRCTLACTFCPKQHGRWTVAGNELRWDREPTAGALYAAAQALEPARFRQVAFVGLGEPTLRLPVVLEVGRRLRAAGNQVRLVTDGLACLREGRDVTAELASAVDEVHVSLNAPDGETYARLCPSAYGAAAHAAACDFIRAAKQRVQVVATVVAAPGLDLPACRRLAQALGVPLRERPWFDPQLGEPHESSA